MPVSRHITAKSACADCQPADKGRLCREEEIYGVTPAALRRTASSIERARRRSGRARSERQDAPIILAEFESAAALLRHACQRGLLALEKNPTKSRALKLALRRDLRWGVIRRRWTASQGRPMGIVKEYARLWHARNRPGGFTDSVARLKKMGKDYER